MDKTFNFRLFRTIERMLQLNVVLGDAIMTVHCALLLTGSQLWIAEFVAGYSALGFVSLLMASYLLHFCWRFRLCLIHSFLVGCCIIFQREYGFDMLLSPMRWVMFVSGVITILLALMDGSRSTVVKQLVESVLALIHKKKTVRLATVRTNGMSQEKINELREDLLDTMVSDDVTQDEEGLHIVNYE